MSDAVITPMLNMMLTDGAKPSAPIAAASTIGACWCGAAMPAASLTGRPRRHCSERCRRRQGHLLKLLDRREDWITEWKRQGIVGLCSKHEAQRAITLLRLDVAELLTALLGPITADKRDDGD
jgi:hypothetical protein